MIEGLYLLATALAFTNRKMKKATAWQSMMQLRLSPLLSREEAAGAGNTLAGDSNDMWSLSFLSRVLLAKYIRGRPDAFFF